jgi:hypothetical protein
MQASYVGFCPTAATRGLEMPGAVINLSIQEGDVCNGEGVGNEDGLDPRRRSTGNLEDLPIVDPHGCESSAVHASAVQGMDSIGQMQS